MIKIRKEYYKALNKYGACGVLNLYRDNKISLNKKEWESLHKRIAKEKNIDYVDGLKTLFSGIICFSILVILCVCFNMRDYEEKFYECKAKSGHVCTKYELEKMEVKK